MNGDIAESMGLARQTPARRQFFSCKPALLPIVYR